MEYIQSIILGTIQGITEFLPISSSGHLVLTPYIFGWDYRGLSFDVALHLGTLLAIVIYFRNDIVLIVKNSCHSVLDTESRNDGILNRSLDFARDDKSVQNDNPKKLRSPDALSGIPTPADRRGYDLKPGSLPKGDPPLGGYPKNFLWQILVATIPAIIVGFFLSDIVDRYLHSPLLIAANLAIFGLLLWLSDRYSKKASEALEAISYRSSLVIGLFQAIALMPGVSRSGITMTAGRLLGYSKETAAKLSFIIGIPATAGAFAYEALKLSRSDINLANLLAILITTVVGFLTIKYLLQYLKRGSFAVFTVYRLLLALVVVMFYLLK
jgi:undecaprenyl-diphosphatase